MAVHGIGQVVYSNEDTIWFNDGSQGEVWGNKNTVVANGNRIGLTIEGEDVTAISEGDGNQLELIGKGAHVLADNDTVRFRSGDSTLEGDNNTIFVDAQYSKMTIIGDNEKIDAGQWNVLLIDGVNNSIEGDSNTIGLSEGSDADVIGFRNTLIGLNSSDFSTKSAEGNLGMNASELFFTTYELEHPEFVAARSPLPPYVPFNDYSAPVYSAPSYDNYWQPTYTQNWIWTESTNGMDSYMNGSGSGVYDTTESVWDSLDPLDANDPPPLFPDPVLDIG